MRTVTQYVVFALLLANPLVATADQERSAQVMLFGVFHFANPGRDLVKTDQVDVMTDENQAYLKALSAKIGKYKPTIVLLEFDPEREPKIQEQFRQYVDSGFELPSNEVYQLGFRIAALSGGATIHGFDETDVHWQAEPLFDYLQSHDAETGARMSALIDRLTLAEQEAQASLSLQELLIRANDADGDALNRATYLLTNHVGDDGNFVGADATASWWHRNFRMYARVQRHAQPGERVLVIGGQGHIAILRQLLADDRDREAVDVRPYLQ